MCFRIYGSDVCALYISSMSSKSMTKNSKYSICHYVWGWYLQHQLCLLNNEILYHSYSSLLRAQENNGLMGS